jgi:BirA family biotin operon repressor/biotin-[acetyl-CoA-carboxylase] ligase
MERGQAAPRALFAAACFTALEDWLDRYAEGGFAAVRGAWRAHNATLGKEVSVRLDGREIIGVADDVDETGALLVSTAAGVERVIAGDVRLLRPR